MVRPKFYFIEASKVRTYHITLIEGYLAAILASSTITAARDLIFCAHSSLWNNISIPLRQQLAYRAIPVIDQDKHHVVRKSLLEFWVLLRAMIRLRRNDILFVSCLMPTALLLVELANFVLRKDNIFVVIHGEIESAYAGEKPHWRTIGYWTIRWLQVRHKRSHIAVVVIDDFIKSSLIARFPNSLDARSVFVVHHPITPIALEFQPQEELPIACFVGHRSPAKGFGEFQRLAAAHPNLHFTAIGGGKIEDVRSGQVKPIGSEGAFHKAIAKSALAVFPYLSAYNCSMSAAVLDALSTGVHIVATPRASFVSLAEAFGPDVVTLCPSLAEIGELMADSARIAALKQGQAKRLRRLDGSKYGQKQVQADFEKICEASDAGASD